MIITIWDKVVDVNNILRFIRWKDYSLSSIIIRC